MNGKWKWENLRRLRGPTKIYLLIYAVRICGKPERLWRHRNRGLVRSAKRNVSYRGLKKRKIWTVFDFSQKERENVFARLLCLVYRCQKFRNGVPTAHTEEVCSVECIRVALVTATSLPPPEGLLLARIAAFEIEPSRQACRDHDITRPTRRRQRAPRRPQA